MTKHKRFYKNTAWQYGLQIIKYFFPLITLPYLTRVLTPDSYAVFAYVLALMGLIGVAIDHGFNLLGTRLIALSKSTLESKQINTVIIITRLALAIPASLIAIGLWLVVPILHENPVYLALAFAATTFKFLSPDYLFQGFQQMGPITIRYFISMGIYTTLVFSLVHSRDDLLLIPLIDIASQLIALLWTFQSARKLFKVSFSKVSVTLMKATYRKSLPYFISNLSAASLTGISTVLVGILIKDAHMISYWSIAVMIISAIQSLYTPITQSLYPYIVSTQNYKFAKKILFFSLPVMTVGTILFAILSPLFIRIIAGEDYVDGAEILIWLSPMLFFSFYAVLLGWPVLGAANQIKKLMTTTVSASILNTLGLLILLLLGIPSILLISIVRNMTEIFLAGSRFIFARTLLKDHEQT